MEEEIQLPKNEKTYKKVEISEFFEGNKHILGFDNPAKAIMTCLKEFCDNSLDACEDENILPNIDIVISKKENGKYLVKFTDNGPGIPSQMVPRVFGKLLFGSKFHVNKQKRGQQGLGASAVVLYSQITTGVPTTIRNRVGDGKETIYVIGIDVKRNEPKIYSKKRQKTTEKRGLTIEVELEATFFRVGTKSITNYLALINTINPYCEISCIDPDGIKTVWKRTAFETPKPPEAYRYYPKNLEVGLLRKYLTDKEGTLSSILSSTFECLEESTLLSKICRISGVPELLDSSLLTTYEVIKIREVINKLDLKEVHDRNFCICGSQLENHLSKIYKNKEVDFLQYERSKVRHYQGSSFVVEVVLCYGGTLPKDKKMEVIRVGNKVPFLFQGGACALQKTLTKFNWKVVGFSQNEGELPIAPAICYVHLVSTKIPFISESKEAVSEVPEIVSAIEECLTKITRSLLKHIEFQLLAKKREEKKEIIEKYFPVLVDKIYQILGKKNPPKYLEILDKINEGIIIKKTENNTFTVQNLYNDKKVLSIEYNHKIYDLSLEPNSLMFFSPEEKQVKNDDTPLFKKLKIRNQSKKLKIFIE